MFLVDRDLSFLHSPSLVFFFSSSFNYSGGAATFAMSCHIALGGSLYLTLSEKLRPRTSVSWMSPVLWYDSTTRLLWSASYMTGRVQVTYILF